MNRIAKLINNMVKGVNFMKTYTIAIHENTEELRQGINVPKYWAQCIEVPGAITQGETIEEIKKNMKEAIELMLESIPEGKIEKVDTNEIIEYVSLEVANA
jgi:predicted RNase H-like HicB family nuclease